MTRIHIINGAYLPKWYVAELKTKVTESFRYSVKTVKFVTKASGIQIYLTTAKHRLHEGNYYNGIVWCYDIHHNPNHPNVDITISGNITTDAAALALGSTEIIDKAPCTP